MRTKAEYDRVCKAFDKWHSVALDKKLVAGFFKQWIWGEISSTEALALVKWWMNNDIAYRKTQ